MTRRLIDGCDAILADLDGVVYAGPGAIPEAPESLERAKSEGVPVMFVTNNATQSRRMYKTKFDKLGVEAHVVSSPSARMHARSANSFPARGAAHPPGAAA